VDILPIPPFGDVRKAFGPYCTRLLVLVFQATKIRFRKCRVEKEEK
jgi:hypothetical protein